jgi:protein involved in sex pheromone biosynthesis
MSEAGELAREMERVCLALAQARVYVAAHDQADSARSMTRKISYSPLRTVLEQGEKTAERVLTYLRDQSRS